MSEGNGPIPQKSRRAWWIFGVTVLIAVLLYPDFFADRIYAWRRLIPGGEPSTITVGAPAVYTRERLINDRSEQMAWIDDQLKLTARRSPFSSAEGQSESSATSEIKPPAGAEASAEKAESEKRVDARPNSESSTQLRGWSSDEISSPEDPLERFQDVNGVRDVMRAERALAMLDDRHDMDGNTLYLLSFDVTTIPGGSNRGYAVVTVLLGHDAKDIGDDAYLQSLPGGAYASHRIADDLRDRDRFELYLDWLDNARRALLDSLDGDTKVLEQLNNKPVPSPQDLELAERIEIHLCRDINEHLVPGMSLTSDLKSSIRSACRSAMQQACQAVAPVADPKTEIADRACQAIKLFREAENLGKKSITKAFESEYKQQLNALAPQLSRNFEWLASTYNDKLFPEALAVLASLKELAAKPLSAWGDYESALYQCSYNAGIVASGPPRFYPKRVQALLESTRNLDLKPSVQVELFSLPCPRPYTMLQKLEVLSLVEESLVARVPSFLPHQLEVNALLSDVPDDPDSPKPQDLRLQINLDGITYAPEQDLLPAKPGVLLNKYQPSCLAAMAEQERFLAGLPTVLGNRNATLSQYFDTELVGDEGECRLEVIQQKLWHKEGEHGQWAAELDEPGPDQLFPSPETFSYALTPKLRHYYHVDRTQGYSAVLGWLGSLFGRTSESRFVGQVSSPVVVGFEPPLPPSPTMYARNASFGWIIGPQQEGSSEGSHLTLEQAQLGALLAVPSWWRSVLLRVCTGFVGQDALPTILQDAWPSPDAWKAPGDNPCSVHVLRLPGTSADVARRLGVEFIRFPYLRAPLDGRSPSLQAGKPGSLLLEGGHLWRSTEATLGAQRADRIRVLPNRDAIIAEFNCVETPTTFTNREERPTYPPGFIYAVPIRVWTSEGVTETRLSAEVVTSGDDVCPDQSRQSPK